MPNETSYGASFKYTDGSSAYHVLLAKGVFVIGVTMYSDTRDLTQTTIGVAQRDYDLMPDAVSSAATTASMPGSVIGLGVAFLVIGSATIIFLALRSARHGVHAPAMATGFQMSPDGAMWWDGARWRDAATELPPGAQRSPGGAYWWDGRSWRRTGEPRP